MQVSGLAAEKGQAVGNFLTSPHLDQNYVRKAKILQENHFYRSFNLRDQIHRMLKIFRASFQNKITKVVCTLLNCKIYSTVYVKN